MTRGEGGGVGGRADWTVDRGPQYWGAPDSGIWFSFSVFKE